MPGAMEGLTWKVLGADADSAGSTVYSERLHTGQVLCDSQLPGNWCAAHWLEVSLGGSNSGNFVLWSVHQCQSKNAWCRRWSTSWQATAIHGSLHVWCKHIHYLSSFWLPDVHTCVPGQGHFACVPSLAHVYVLTFMILNRVQTCIQ